jgi:hypothetical protein
VPGNWLGRSAGRLVGRTVRGKTAQLVSQPVDWSVGRSAGRLVDPVRAVRGPSSVGQKVGRVFQGQAHSVRECVGVLVKFVDESGKGRTTPSEPDSIGRPVGWSAGRPVRGQ